MVGHPLIFWSRCSRVDIRYRIVTFRPYTITFYCRVKALPIPIWPFVLRSVGAFLEGLDTFRGQWVGRKVTRPIGVGFRGAGRGGLFDTSHQVSKSRSDFLRTDLSRMPRVCSPAAWRIEGGSRWAIPLAAIGTPYLMPPHTNKSIAAKAMRTNRQRLSNWCSQSVQRAPANRFAIRSTVGLSWVSNFSPSGKWR